MTERTLFMATPLKEGDVVYLNSGSPPLTIVRLLPAENDATGARLAVSWPDDVGELQTIVLPMLCFHR